MLVQRDDALCLLHDRLPPTERRTHSVPLMYISSDCRKALIESLPRTSIIIFVFDLQHDDRAALCDLVLLDECGHSFYLTYKLDKCVGSGTIDVRMVSRRH